MEEKSDNQESDYTALVKKKLDALTNEARVRAKRLGGDAWQVYKDEIQQGEGMVPAGPIVREEVEAVIAALTLFEVQIISKGVLDAWEEWDRVEEDGSEPDDYVLREHIVNEVALILHHLADEEHWEDVEREEEEEAKERQYHEAIDDMRAFATELFAAIRQKNGISAAFLKHLDEFERQLAQLPKFPSDDLTIDFHLTSERDSEVHLSVHLDSEAFALRCGEVGYVEGVGSEVTTTFDCEAFAGGGRSEEVGIPDPGDVEYYLESATEMSIGDPDNGEMEIWKIPPPIEQPSLFDSES